MGTLGIHHVLTMSEWATEIKVVVEAMMDKGVVVTAVAKDRMVKGFDIVISAPNLHWSNQVILQ